MKTIAVPKVPIDWKNAIFLWGIVLITLIGLPVYFMYHPVNWAIVIFSAFYLYFCGFGITAGYHRYFCHKSFKAHPIVEWYFLLFGAANWQGPISFWLTDHKYHHMYPDTEKDPYAITKGFWYAHMGWLIRRVEPALIPEVLEHKNIMWQHRHFNKIALVTGFLIPALVGYLLGDWVQGLLLGGFARVFYSEQSTFLINSAAHTFGDQPNKKTSARNNWFLIWATAGEGWHNNHHAHPQDYRHGFKWYHYDPTKWFIDSLSTLGLVYDKKKTHH
jgi:stearoyl-CoA desaturase (delta-9 desaturase)